MKIIFLPTYYRIPAEVVRTRDNGNYDIIANNVLIGNVEPRHVEIVKG